MLDIEDIVQCAHNSQPRQMNPCCCCRASRAVVLFSSQTVVSLRPIGFAKAPFSTPATTVMKLMRLLTHRFDFILVNAEWSLWAWGHFLADQRTTALLLRMLAKACYTTVLFCSVASAVKLFTC